MALETIGCRLNQYETEKMAARLLACGFERVSIKDDADVYIINTCTVTGRADATCRNIISRIARREKKSALVVAGCYVDADPEKMASLTGVDLIIPNSRKDDIVAILMEKFPALFDGRLPHEDVAVLIDFHEHNRAWIKIGAGCNQNCAYCIIPRVRGRIQNRPADEIIREINCLSENGYNEVVLTGVHIGKYRDAGAKSLSDLIGRILERTPLSRVRLSSIEPQEVDDELLGVMHDGGRRVCRHLHIPLQSGSDRILRIMHRPYLSDDYIRICENAKNKIPGLVIGADIIVGFPGETDEDFGGSVNVARSGVVDYIHAFSYSDRPGTEASLMSGKIKPDIIKQRNRILREISADNYERALKREIGRTAYIISEYRDEGGSRYYGMTDNYLQAVIPHECGGGKKIIAMQVTGADANYLSGEIIG